MPQGPTVAAQGHRIVNDCGHVAATLAIAGRPVYTHTMDPQRDLFPPVAEDLVEGLRYVPSFVSAADETRLLAAVDAEPWLADLKRRVQHYGYKYDYKARSISRSMFVGPLPPFAIELADAMIAAGILLELPDQLIVNEYVPGQGISPHIDCEPCFAERIVTVSLGSQCEMEFRPKEGYPDDKAAPRKVMLEPRSALLISGKARYEWLHSIRSRLSDRGRARSRRVSLTFRNVILRDDKSRA